MHPEQRANRMYLNKRTNSTEELQLKQDQDLKEEQEKTRFISKNEMGTNNNKKRNETKIEIVKAKKGNVADLLICSKNALLSLIFSMDSGFWARYLS